MSGIVGVVIVIAAFLATFAFKQGVQTHARRKHRGGD